MADNKHRPKAERKWACERHRHGKDHETNCMKNSPANQGYTKSGECQIHHILSVSCAQDSKMPPAKRPYIRECLQITDWNINAGHNQIGLPLKEAYRKYEKLSVKPSVVGWDNLPCHQTDHTPLYLNEVVDKIKLDVYDPLNEAKDSKKCWVVDPHTIKKELEGVSDFFRGELGIRGRRGPGPGGTKYCWDHRDLHPNDWYLPFSMAINPVKRKPLPKSKKNLALAKILERLKP